MKTLFYFLVFFLLVGSYGCGKKKTGPDTGNEKPLITVVYKNIPTVSELLCGSVFDNVLKINTGERLELTLRFSGSQVLSQYKIDIHNNFDCHLHGARPTGAPWQLLQLIDLHSKDTTVTELLTVPADAAVGNYHLMIQLLDEAGNEADFIEFNLVLTNPEDVFPPVIALTNPAADSVTVAVGDELTFAGTVTDNRSLKNGRLEIDFTDASGEDYSALKTYFQDTAITGFDFNMPYTIPAFPAKGWATFRLKAFDEVNNVAEKVVYVNIL